MLAYRHYLKHHSVVEGTKKLRKVVRTLDHYCVLFKLEFEIPQRLETVAILRSAIAPAIQEPGFRNLLVHISRVPGELR